MQADRYLKAILTIIALELGWLAVTQGAQPVAAQRQSEPQRVVITGVQIDDQRAFLPVAVMGQYRNIPAGVNLTPPHTTVGQGPSQLRVTIDTSQAPLRVDLPVPIVVNVEPGNSPLRTQEVPFTPQPRPGL
jgi:hypothetical protein